ncbi:hypothetical protein HNQ96_002166 [Aminobacter lissarensis]|uniref:Uncharacterized protein n=1 Tax=Aminobacter carboxidus TaxID=376165 RepID=A0A8E1WEY1_9HYPH|nr:hypothetical protein [Aminobacter lissarensis]MBB6466301.1 hypothetical protein [Aminobacter lissarensis]
MIAGFEMTLCQMADIGMHPPISAAKSPEMARIFCLFDHETGNLTGIAGQFPVAMFVFGVEWRKRKRDNVAADVPFEQRSQQAIGAVIGGIAQPAAAAGRNQ